MTEENVKLAINAALAELLRRDSYLLEKDVNERSVSHRLAIYLEAQFSGWDVDCEYNRNHDDAKRLRFGSRGRVTDYDVEAVTVFPDIIIHHRSTNENLLVIEMKKTTSKAPVDYDIRKLKAFKEELGYTFAVFVQLASGSQTPKIEALEYI